MPHKKPRRDGLSGQSNVITLRGQGDEHVPENWGPAYCRARALEWRERAVVLPEDHPERSVCLELAEGYDKMATLLEQREPRGCHGGPPVPLRTT